MPGTHPYGFDLHEAPDGQLWIVERTATGYTVHEVTTRRMKSYDRKWQAVKAIAENEVEEAAQ